MAEADTEDQTPFAPPQQQGPPPLVPGMPEFENIRNQWMSFMDQPGARAALLNTGIALMQPPHFGDTPASQIGRAIGAGAEAATRGEALSSKQELEQARSESARSRAGEATTRLGLEYFRRQSIERGQAGANVKAAQEAYRRDMKALQDVYTARLKDYNDLTKLPSERGPKPEAPPEVTFDQWLRSPRGAHFSALPGISDYLIGSQSKPPERPQAQEETE